MRVGITGASGFLGSAIVAEIVRRGWTPVGFSRDPDTEIEGVAEVRSLSDRKNIDLSSLDAVIHLAGEPIVGWWSKEKKARIRKSRIELTSDLVTAMSAIPRSRRPAVFVSASAVGYYGDRGDTLLDEESDPGFGFLPEVCRAWEAEAMKGAKLGVRVVTPRIGIVIGQEGFLKKLRPLFRLNLGARLGRGDQWMSWIHIEDLARIFLLCVETGGIHGRVNCVSPRPVQNREFTETYAKVLGRKAFLRIPRWVFRRLPGGMGSLFLDSQRADPVVLKANSFAWKFAIMEDALRAVKNRRIGEESSASEDAAEKKG